ncbi:hypothetical protein ATANTOWER_009009 [Ataeniobius toweri]|uniref:Uncharacterized protein n=1 Tax=Ataeniobius toweri TaxID=208326 RepID=A0ABU7C339_9TELE|nr:hypothetical protein [Ataeniobius toweri]
MNNERIKFVLMFPHSVNAVYILVLVILSLCSVSLSRSLRFSLHPLQSARGGVSPRAKHMLLSIALIQMQRGGIIARVAVASQGLCPSLGPVNQAHAISISSATLFLCASVTLRQPPDPFYQTGFLKKMPFSVDIAASFGYREHHLC